jgi:hypothetical protein
MSMTGGDNETMKQEQKEEKEKEMQLCSNIYSQLSKE